MPYEITIPEPITVLNPTTGLRMILHDPIRNESREDPPWSILRLLYTAVFSHQTFLVGSKIHRTRRIERCFANGGDVVGAKVRLENDEWVALRDFLESDDMVYPSSQLLPLGDAVLSATKIED